MSVAASTPVVCVDLDRTLIYSPSALAIDGDDAAAPRLVCVELYRGAPLSFVTEAAAGLLRELAARVVLVPTTTRTPAQLARVHLLPGPPTGYAIASNGGHLLVDGVPDPQWSASVRRAVSACAAVEEVRAHVESTSGDFVETLRTASDLFVYAVVRRPDVPAGWVQELSDWCAARGWHTSLQGRKVYCVPRPLTKSAAAREVLRRTGGGWLTAAGDSLLDAELLMAADEGVRPAAGELADSGWEAAHVHVTSAPGVRGGEELVRWLLGRATPSPNGHRRDRR
jgi:hypothetical protein